MGGKGSGRRPKYTLAVHESIVENIRLGAFKCHAAAMAGISPRVLDVWLEQGRTGIGPYVQLALDVDKAQAEDAIRNQAIISRAAGSASAGDWKAAAWSLSKKYPKLYGSAAALAAEREVLRELADKDDRRQRVYSPWKDADPDVLDS